MPLKSQNLVCRLYTSLKRAIVFENNIQHNEAYNIIRRPAKEVILAIISDLDRGHKDTERHHAIPVAYYISWFSLKMHAVHAMHAFEGQFLEICTKDDRGNPLIMCMLQEYIWQNTR